METMHKEATITPWIDFTEGLKKTAKNISLDNPFKV
jgi:hypothetical protein